MHVKSEFKVRSHARPGVSMTALDQNSQTNTAKKMRFAFCWNSSVLLRVLSLVPTILSLKVL